MTIAKGQSYKHENGEIYIITGARHGIAYIMKETTPGRYKEDFCTLSDLYRGLYEGWLKPNFKTSATIAPEIKIQVTFNYGGIEQ